MVAGIAISSGWIVAVGGGWCAKFGGVTRIVRRNIARHRTRTGPLVAAMAATGAATILAVTALNSELNKPIDDRSDQMISQGGGTSAEADRLITRISAILPDTKVIKWSIQRPQCQR